MQNTRNDFSRIVIGTAVQQSSLLSQQLAEIGNANEDNAAAICALTGQLRVHLGYLSIALVEPRIFAELNLKIEDVQAFVPDALRALEEVDLQVKPYLAPRVGALVVA